MRSMTESTFGDLLRRLRSDAGLTQEELAERAGLSARAISDLERGVNRYPYRATVQSLIRALTPAAGDAAELAERAQRRRRFREPVPARRPVPIPPNAILGRERELGGLLHLVRWEGIRFVTLTGPGGVGKTRLAEEAAREIENDFAHGCAIVPLASVTAPQLVSSAVAAALDIRASGSMSAEDALLASLREQELFLVLDNFEHLLPAGGLVSRLLAGCPKLKVLVTSREPLRLRGEQEIDVSPLPVPRPGRVPPLEDLRHVPSVALLVQRARSRRSDFDLGDGNAGTVAEICRRLDGLPLAIELAAAQLKYRSPEWLLDQMSRRLEVLGPGPRDLPARQQTMRATIEWSFGLLDPPEQAVFRCIAVFAGGGDADGLGAVAGALGIDGDCVVPALTALAGKSLLVLDAAHGDRFRFSALETVRQFAADRLDAGGDGAKARAAHADFFLRLAEEAYPNLTQENADYWIRRLLDELDNFRSALRWCIDSGEAATGLQLAGALWRVWLWSGLLQEGGQWLDRMLRHDDTATAPDWTRARALFGSGVLSYRQGDLQASETRFLQAQALFRELSDERGLGDALNGLGSVATEKNEYRRARAYLEEALAIRRKGDSPFDIGASLNNLAEVAYLEGDLERAAALYEEALGAYRLVGEPLGVRLTTFGNLARLACLQGDYERAREISLQCLEWARSTSPWNAAEALDNLGNIALARGDLDAAEERYRDALAGFEAVHDTGNLALVLVHLANLYRARGDYDRASWSATRSLREQEKTGVNERIAAYAHLYLGDVERERRDFAGADGNYRVALEVSARIEHVAGVTECLEHIGWLRASTNPGAAAVLAAADGVRRRRGIALPPVDGRYHQTALEELRRHLGGTAFDEAWNRGASMDWREAASFALSSLAGGDPRLPASDS